MVLNSIRSPQSLSLNYSETVGWLIGMHYTAPKKWDYGLLKKHNSLVPQNWFLGRFHQSETRTEIIKCNSAVRKEGAEERSCEQRSSPFIQWGFCWVLCLTSATAFLLLAFLVKTAGKGREFSQVTELRGHFPKIKCGPGAQLGNKHRIHKQN